MGTDYYAYAVIGLRVDPKKLFEVVTKDKRNCDCNVHTSYKFCPDCGKRMWKKVTRPEFKYQEGQYGFSNSAMIAGYDVIWGTFEYADNTFTGWMPSEAVIAVGYATTPPGKDEYESINITDGLNTARMNMKERLKSTGLWEDENFGLHAVLRVSY